MLRFDQVHWDDPMRLWPWLRLFALALLPSVREGGVPAKRWGGRWNRRGRGNLSTCGHSNSLQRDAELSIDGGAGWKEALCKCEHARGGNVHHKASLLM
eukprot:scaffold1397_cov254-Pinguiococcus_pyrenoidosus.AAC.16